jgi:antitoxin (DNA-binding transcriptional repressor) of toxin-antitoxin stability system
MPTVSKSALQDKLSEDFGQVEDTGEDLIVIDDGGPVVKVAPTRVRTTAAAAFGDVRGRAMYGGDILAPTTHEWPET